MLIHLLTYLSHTLRSFLTSCSIDHSLSPILPHLLPFTASHSALRDPEELLDSWAHRILSYLCLWTHRSLHWKPRSCLPCTLLLFLPSLTSGRSCLTFIVHLGTLTSVLIAPVLISTVCHRDQLWHNSYISGFQQNESCSRARTMSFYTGIPTALHSVQHMEAPDIDLLSR